MILKKYFFSYINKIFKIEQDLYVRCNSNRSRDIRIRVCINDFLYLKKKKISIENFYFSFHTND